MKSPMVQNAAYISDKSGYSDLQVMRSSAGWYVGTTYTDPEDGFEEPGSRDSDYFATEAQASAYLKAINENESVAAAGFMTRTSPADLLEP